MKRKTILLVLIILLLAVTAGVVLSNAGTGLQIAWWTVDGGGGVSLGGDYLLQGTAGQFDAGTMHGESYTLSGGFWQATEAVVSLEKVMLPVIIR